MTPMAYPSATNALQLNPLVLRSDYVCTTADCTFVDASAALADEHLAGNTSHTIVIEYTRSDA